MHDTSCSGDIEPSLGVCTFGVHDDKVFYYQKTRITRIIQKVRSSLHFCRVLNITFELLGKRVPEIQNSRGISFPSSSLIS